MKSAEWSYRECQTCARKGDVYCIGCQPTRTPDGRFSRSLYTPHNGPITVTSQITIPASEVGGEKVMMTHEQVNEIENKFRQAQKLVDE